MPVSVSVISEIALIIVRAVGNQGGEYTIKKLNMHVLDFVSNGLLPFMGIF